MKMLKYVLGFACATASVATQAGILLNVNISNPAAVTFTATTATSELSGAPKAEHGFSLLNFFGADVNFQFPPTFSDLTGGGYTVDRVRWDGPITQGAGRDLNFADFSGFFTDTMSFVQGERALSGSATVNLTSVMNLPPNGATGQIRLGSENNNVAGVVIGSWTAVPEPASVSVAAGLALGGFAFVRRRSARRVESGLNMAD